MSFRILCGRLGEERPGGSQEAVGTSGTKGAGDGGRSGIGRTVHNPAGPCKLRCLAPCFQAHRPGHAVSVGEPRVVGMCDGSPDLFACGRISGNVAK